MNDYDGWLEKHIPNEGEKLTILELGCGWGADTSFLAKTGHRIISCDYTNEIIEGIKALHPAVETALFDMRGRFPFRESTADIVIASLCLHFFSEGVLKDILTEIRRVLKIEGKFLCRLNSEKDRTPNVPGEKELAPGLYMTSSGLKMFYDEERIKAAFKDWEIINLKEYETIKLSRRKFLYEIEMKNS